MTGDDEKRLSKASSLFLKDLLNVKESERILFYTDDGSDPHIPHILFEGAKGLGAEPEVFELDSSIPFPDMADLLTEKVDQGVFDIVCELSEQYFYQTAAWERALEKKARLYSIGGIKADGFIRCIGAADHDLIYEFGTSLRALLDTTKSVQICSREGTDIRLEMNISLTDRIIAKLTGRERPYAFITPPSGKLTPKIPATFLGGQVAFNGIPETIEGTFAIDGYIWPPQEIGMLDEPVRLQIKKGRVIDIHGSSEKSRIFTDWLAGKKNEIKHFCIGFHPGALLTGTLAEAERVFGCISIGIGEFPYHTDGVITNPTLLLDKRVIEKEGSFIQEDLLNLEKKLKAFTSTMRQKGELSTD